jgi:hypothetical protein
LITLLDKEKSGFLPADSNVMPELALSAWSITSFTAYMLEALILLTTSREFSEASDPLVISFFQFGISCSIMVGY